MRLLFDQGTPAPLRGHLKNHSVVTVVELGWSQLSNGDLLAQALKEGFEGLVTTDQNLKYQQNLPERSLAVVVLMTTSWPRIERHLQSVCAQIDLVKARSYVEIVVP